MTTTVLYVVAAVGLLLWVRYSFVPGLVRRAEEADAERSRQRGAPPAETDDEEPPPTS